MLSNAIQAYDLTENIKIVVAYFTVCINDSPIFVHYPYLYGNLDIGTTMEYQKASLASHDMSALDKPLFQLENMLRRFIHESSPDDARKIVSLDEIWEIASFQDMYGHVGRQEMMQDVNILELKVKRQRLKIKDHIA
ncbi:hypothetical protein Tco_1318462 [Tanacetum coccineum]